VLAASLTLITALLSTSSSLLASSLSMASTVPLSATSGTLKATAIATPASYHWFALNDSNQVAGFAYTGSTVQSPTKAVRWDNGVTTTLTSDAPNAGAFAIDSAGVTFGGIGGGGATGYPVMWSTAGTLTKLTAAGGALNALSDGVHSASGNGNVVGLMSNATTHNVGAWFYALAPAYAVVPLGVDAGSGMVAINDVGNIAVGSTTAPYLVVNGAHRSLKVAITTGFDLNNNGDVAGALVPAPTSGAAAAIELANGTVQVLPPLHPGDGVTVNAINDHDEAVGYESSPSGTEIAVAWINGKVVSVASLVSGTFSTPVDPLDVNNNGSILAQFGVGYYLLGAPTNPLSLTITAPAASGSGSAPTPSAPLVVGAETPVQVTVTAVGTAVNAINLGKGLVSTGAALVTGLTPPGIDNFDLAQGASRTFVFTLKGTNDGIAALRVNATGTTASGSVQGSAQAQLTVAGSQFDYEMPPRWGATGDLDLNHDPKVYNPSQWPVLFTINPGDCDTKADYTWFVDNKPVVDKPGPRTCTFWVEFKNLDTYTVKFRQLMVGSPSTESPPQKVVVQDFVIASIGDSMASGEGDPPYTTTGIHSDILCHRSNDAYTAVASKQIEADDPHSSVTFIPLACSGTTLSGDYTYGTIKYQLGKLKDLIGDRQIGALTISVGINDLDFAYVMWACWRDYRCQNQIIDTEKSLTIKNLFKGLPQERLGELESRLMFELSYSDLKNDIRDVFSDSQLKNSDIYLVDYLDPLFQTPGEVCPVLIPGVGGVGFQNTGGQGEVYWAQGSIVAPLEHMEATAAESYGWHFVQLPASVVQSHGYCNDPDVSWFNNIVETGDQFTSAALSVAGIFHPKPIAQQAVADELLKNLKAALLPGGEPRAPS